MSQHEIATLGGGCFWCIEAPFRETKGVISAVSGYMGGASPKPSYKAVCSGTTGHVEVAQITFDPAIITFGEVLEIFFTLHDPTQLDRQGNDFGTQYRSVIFYHSPEQKAEAESFIVRLTAEKVFDGRIVTAIEPAPEFWPAEDYHQDYLANNPHQPYCMFVVAPKLEKFRKKFAERRK